MKRITLVILAIVLTNAIASGQTTGNATANACSISNTGSNVTQLTIHCGIGQQQGQKIISILNKIIANQLDFSVVMAKLNEIEAAQRQIGAGNTQPGSANCPNNAGNCAGVNNGTQIVQGYVPPPYRVVSQPDIASAIQTLKNAPGGGVSFIYIGSTDDPEISAFFSQIRGIFAGGQWRMLGTSTSGVMNSNVNGVVSHGEGFHCTVDGSAAGAAAKQAVEIAGYECAVGSIEAPMMFRMRPGMTPPPTPNVEISIGTRIMPQR